MDRTILIDYLTRRHKVDNSSVVPHSPKLTSMFEFPVPIEFCILLFGEAKHLFKYSRRIMTN